MDERCIIQDLQDHPDDDADEFNLDLSQNLSVSQRAAILYSEAVRHTPNATPPSNIDNGLLDQLRLELEGLKGSHRALLERCQRIEEENADLRSEIDLLKRNQPAQVSNVIVELEERRRRGNNIIISGLPESPARRPRNRSTEDSEAVLRFLTNLKPDSSPEDLLHVARLGKKRGGCVRPLKVVLKDTSLARQYLKLARRSTNQRAKVMSDRTPAQQEELAALRRELAEKQESDASLTIRYRHGVPQISRQGNGRRQQ